MKRLKADIFRYRTKKGRMHSEWVIYEWEIFGWTFLHYHGLKTFKTRADADEYIRLYRAVCRNWKRKNG